MPRHPLSRRSAWSDPISTGCQATLYDRRRRTESKGNSCTHDHNRCGTPHSVSSDRPYRFGLSRADTDADAMPSSL